VSRKSVYTKEIGYNTKKTVDDKKELTYQKVKVKGENGKKQYEDMVTYVDGIETERSNISTVMLKEPVDEQVVVGGKKPAKKSAVGNLSNGGKDSTQSASGKFIWPVAGGYVSSGYGARRGHTGMDIAAPRGTSVYAADAGVVIKAGWGGGYGNCVKIQHGNGYVTLYGHNSSLNVRVGQRVSKGQLIAKVGSTGRSSGNHCHFEIIKNGSFQNPANYVGRR